MISEREKFLKEYGFSYPSAARTYVSVRDLGERAEPIWVGGRVTRTEDAIFLESDGVRCPLNIPKTLRLQVAGHPTEFRALEVLSNGDLIGICIKASSKNEVEEIEFLSFPQGRDFPVGRSFGPERGRLFSEFLKSVRQFFFDRGFQEAVTPTLVPSPGLEPHLEPFKTVFLTGAKEREFYLPTSPEFHLKKMLVLGWTKVFEIKTCFRNGFSELGERHQPEFLMLEWYRAYSNLDQISKDVRDLLHVLFKTPRIEEVSVAELFHKYLKFELTPKTTFKELQSLAAENQITASASDTWDDLYFRIFLEKIEPFFSADRFVLLRDYPPTQAALARLNSRGWADRFELYYDGIELANAFHELNDPVQQQNRFNQDMAEKRRLGLEAVPVDEEFMSALYFGLPPSGGIALGLERLFMVLSGISDIREARAFPL